LQAEIIAVGAELLLDHITHAKAHYLTKQFKSMSVEVCRQISVEAHEDCLRQVIEAAAKRVQLIILISGFEKSQDQLIKVVLAHSLGLKLMVNRIAIESFIDSDENNVKKSLILENSLPFPDHMGVVNGCALTFCGHHYLLLPGTLNEIKWTFETYAKSWLLNILNSYADFPEKVDIETAIVKALSSRGATICVAESCTGGLLCNLITSVPGSSSCFRGGIISYSNEWKMNLLNVPIELLEGDSAPGAISSATAQAMAEQLLLLANTDFAVSITGNAGPTAAEDKPVGIVYAGLAQKNKPTIVVEMFYTGDRETIKLKSARAALYYLWNILLSVE